MGRDRKSNEERRKATRQKIVQATLDLCAERGYHMVSPKDISQEAGVSVGILYHYFKNKKEIAVHLIETLGAALVEEVEKGFYHAPTYKESVKQGYGMLFDYVEQNKAGFTAMIREIGNEELKEHIDGLIDRLVLDSARRIGEQQDLGILRKDVHGEIAAALIQDMAFSAVRMYLEGRFSCKDILDVLIKIQVQGLEDRQALG
ncbi:transcriptional regulator, TetR family [Desulfatibacillum alkenivorans DSM 16219]|uniref:Transcriptional regulator, TetR family n=1 Tax=Desulfatibacillum alkenivorans DSM 16219 TaxID=1121393 RepID=A0A1M6QNU0_9BACT|nr:TetR/AcrR family transcriptional regulator [Desulfatibacillum alkenivorans]SHK21959.1 transcriptional regulator, TetR family [Desulfatibacillum alkenivorans DSM 16219]